MITPLYCVFPDRATALMVAKALVGDPELEDFAKDGWFNGIYWNIDVVFGTGEVFDEEGNRVPGFHINGLWRDAPETIPPEVQAFMTHPSTPVCVFG